MNWRTKTEADMSAKKESERQLQVGPPQRKEGPTPPLDHESRIQEQNKNLLRKYDRESQAWIESSPICTKILDLDFKLRYISSAGARELEIDDLSKYYGTPYPFSFYPDSLRLSMAENLAKVKNTGEPADQEDYVTNTKGEKLWYRSTIVPVKNEEGQVDQIMIQSVNFTPQKKAEDSLKNTLAGMESEMAKRNAALYKSEERLSQAMRGANDGLWDWNLETNEVYYSPRWKSMLGYEEHELKSNLDTWETLVHPDDKERTLEAIKDYVEGRADSYEVEARMCHKDGHEIVVLSRAFLVQRDSNNKPARMVGTHVDITERTKSEQFILATSNILKMIATRDPASDIYDAIALLYESRHPGLRCSMLILAGNKLMHGGAPSLPKAYCEAVNGLENGPSVGSCGTATYYGTRILVEDIETDPKWAEIKHVALPHGMRCCWSEPIKDSKGEVLGAFGMYYDYPALPNDSEANDLASAARLAGIIMEREKSENELNQHKNHLEELVAKRTLELEETKKEAEKANRAKSSFLSSMSHELRTPLNAIIGFAQVLESDPTDHLTQNQQESVGHILKSGDHLLELINEILDLSQIEEGRIPLSIAPIQLDKAITEALKIIQPTAEKFKVSIVNKVSNEPGTEVYILADCLRLKQILLNLLSNGIKYNRPGGMVTIEVISNENDHQIIVQDTGIGIRKEDADALFEPFNRLGAQAMDIEGTGIGLTITKRLVEVMEGSLNILSTPGEGTTVTVTMPAGKGTPGIQADSAVIRELPRERKTRNDQITVLYVEDHFVNVKLVENILNRRPGIRLVVASNGRQGIELANKELPSLILMDINLPDISGVEVFRHLKMNEATARIPVVGVSADAMLDVVDRRKMEGFHDYLTKPFRIDHFLGIIDSIIDTRSTDQSSLPSKLDFSNSHESQRKDSSPP